MRPLGVRFTMRRMMAWVIFAGVMLALVRYSVMNWGAEGLTYLAHWTFLAIVMLPGRRPGRRAMFPAAFAGYGMLYLSFTNFGFLSLPFRLPTGLILDGIYDRLPPGVSISAIDFHQAGHVVFAVLIGTVVGLMLVAQVPANLPIPEPMPFRAQVRANFPTVFGLWARMRSPGR